MATPAAELRRERTASAMEKAALQLFAEHGYHAVSIEQIAAAVGVHERTVLRYFRAKEDLLLSLPRRAVRQMCEELKRRPPQESAIEATCQAVIASRSIIRGEDDDTSLLWAAAVATNPAAFVAVIAEHMHDMSEAIAGRMDATVPPEVAQAVGHAIAGAVHGLWREWLEEGGQADFAELTCRGLRVLESVGARAQAALMEENRELRRQIEDLQVERELFKRAAANLLGDHASG